LPQTVLFRDDPVNWLMKLAQANHLPVFLNYLKQMKLDAAEFLVVRDQLEMEQWSVLFSMVSVFSYATCLMAQFHPERYQHLLTLAPDWNRDANPELYAQKAEKCEQFVAAYVDYFESKLFTPSLRERVDLLGKWTPLKLLSRRQQKGLELANIFALSGMVPVNTFALAITELEPLLFALLHMAKFAPEDFASLEEDLSPIPDPDDITGESVYAKRIELALDRRLSEYLQMRLELLSKITTDEEEFSDSDFRGLFNLS
jgi:hypothetical protein